MVTPDIDADISEKGILLIEHNWSKEDTYMWILASALEELIEAFNDCKSKSDQGATGDVDKHPAAK